MEYILTFWADGSAVGLVDLLTSLGNFVYFTLFFRCFGNGRLGGQGPLNPLAYHIIYQMPLNTLKLVNFHAFVSVFGICIHSNQIEDG